MGEALPKVPGFVVEGYLGGGGMGQVYRARQVSLDRPVALKRLHADRARPDAPGYGTWVARLKREAQMLAAVRHPNIVVVHDLIEHDGAPWVIMERVEGISLREAIDKRGALEAGDALELARQLASGLAAAHEAGVIHRDIKPANLMLASDSTLKILDFGLARACEPAGAATGSAVFEVTTVVRTQPGAFVGTPGYAAPEQVLGEVVDQRADVFAFGCVVYELLTGVPAFDPRGGRGAGVVLDGEVEWGRVPPGLSAEVGAVLKSCLERDRTRRPPGLREVAAVLGFAEAGDARTTLPGQRPGRRAGVLPLSMTSFVGRQAEIADVLGSLRRSRLVTLVGLGGVGKTRLALRVGERVADEPVDGVGEAGVWWVSVGTTSTARQTAQSLARALGVRSGGPGQVADEIVAHLGRAQALVVLDECESMGSTQRRLVERLLRECPGLRVLATSRDRLGLAGEQVVMVGPLTGADEPAAGVPLTAAAPSDAATLFVERARLAWPALPPPAGGSGKVEAICRRVGRIPLGIELVAGWADVLSVDEIHERVVRGYSGLDASGERSLGRVIEWSYGRLGQKERSLLRRLSVFTGDFPLSAAERLADDRPAWPGGASDGDRAVDAGGVSVGAAEMLGLVGELVRKSLLVRRPGPSTSDPRTRYTMLDPVREFVVGAPGGAGEREVEDARARMIAWAVETLESAGPELEGPDQGRRMEMLHADYPIIRGALTASMTPRVSAASLRMIVALERFWYRAWFTQEAQEWVERALAAPGAGGVLEARAWKTAGVVAGMGENPSAAAGHYQRGLAALDGCAGQEAEELRARLLNNRGLALGEAGAYSEAREAFAAALEVCARNGDARVKSHVQLNWGSTEIRAGDRGRAIALLSEAVRAFARDGDSMREGVAAFNLAELEFRQGRLGAALGWVSRSLSAARVSGDRAGVALSALAGATIAARAGLGAEAEPLLRSALQQCETMGLPTSVFDGTDLDLARSPGSGGASMGAGCDESLRELLTRIVAEATGAATV